MSEFVAKDQMSSTVGFVIFFQGFGNLAGPPFAGKLGKLNLGLSRQMAVTSQNK